jgi:hypothetical protein
MRPHAVLLLLLTLGLASCDAGSPSPPGTLLVSTATTGNHPDDDGYLLRVDDDHSTPLGPTDTVSLEVPSGRHVVTLVGVAEHCTVAPELPLEIVIESSGTTPVALDVDCQTTGARVTVTTTGVDLDPDGYRLVVDGVDRQSAPANGTTVVLLGSGRHTLMLQGFADNCTRDGAVSQTVTVSDAQVVPVTFAVICRATVGVIQVSLAPGDVEGVHEVRLDERNPQPLAPGHFVYFARVAPGDHVISLTSPGHCHTDQTELPATVTAGGVTRDTVEVVFPVVCEPTRLLITAPTTGPAPDRRYTAWDCDINGYFCYYYGYSYLGPVPPNDTLLVPAEPGVSYLVELQDLPGECGVTGSNPVQPPPALPGDTVVVEFPVACSP